MQPEWTHNEEAVLTSLNGSQLRLIPSSDGPKLLIDREEYLLKEACWDVEMFHGRSSSILIFYWKGEVKLSVKIPPLSQVDAFLTRLFQCLTFKAKAVLA